MMAEEANKRIQLSDDVCDTIKALIEISKAFV
jgi:hypothetical protein